MCYNIIHCKVLEVNRVLNRVLTYVVFRDTILICMKGVYQLELQRLNELLQYLPQTGEILSRASQRTINPDEDGSYTIYDNLTRIRTKFKADRLCWILGNGKKLRKNQKILHKNLKKKDNRLSNLVVVSPVVYSKVQEAAKNLGGGLKIQPSLKDKWDFIVSYFHNKINKKEQYCDIIAAQQRLIVLQLKYAKVLTTYCCFD